MRKITGLCTVVGASALLATGAFAQTPRAPAGSELQSGTNIQRETTVRAQGPVVTTRSQRVARPAPAGSTLQSGSFGWDFAYGAPVVYGSTVYEAPIYGYGPAYGYAAPAPGFAFGSVYSRERDLAFEPDPQIRRELRRSQVLNLDLQP